MTDQELITKIREGELFLYSKMFIYKNMVYNFVRKRGGSKEEAEDVFQNTMLVMIEKINSNFKLEPNTKLSTFFLSIGKNIWMVNYKKKKRFVYEVNDDQLVFENHYNHETNEILNKKISKLSPQYKKLIDLFYFDNKNLKEIAKELKYKNVDTVKSNKNRAMNRLKEIILKEYKKDDFYYV